MRWRKSRPFLRPTFATLTALIRLPARRATLRQGNADMTKWLSHEEVDMPVSPLHRVLDDVGTRET